MSTPASPSLAAGRTDVPDWPDIPKPELPPGYSWVCLRPALGLENPDGTHPWWIRVQWLTGNGKTRMLRLGGPEHFATPQEAIRHAVNEAMIHRCKRAKK